LTQGFFEQYRQGAVVYLIGDMHQRIYRWRGAGDSFEAAHIDKEFALTESFRFGQEIAQHASMILRLKGVFWTHPLFLTSHPLNPNTLVGGCPHQLVGLGEKGKVSQSLSLILPIRQLNND